MPVMSAIGQKRTSENIQSMSALPPKADIAECDGHQGVLPRIEAGWPGSLSGVPTATSLLSSIR